MVKQLATLAALLLVAPTVAGQRRTAAPVWLNVETHQPVVDGRRVSITVVRVPLRDFRLAVAVPKQNEVGDSLDGFLEHYAAMGVLSGGFLASFYPPIPLGLVKAKGAVVNRFSKPDEVITGMLALTDGRPAIQSAQAFSHERWEECLQSGPVIVTGGRTSVSTSPKTKAAQYLIDAWASRAVIATAADDHVLLIHAGPVRLGALAELLAKSRSDGGFGAIDALNLSGASTAGLLVNAAGREVVAGKKDARLPNAIVVQARVSARTRRR